MSDDSSQEDLTKTYENFINNIGKSATDFIGRENIKFINENKITISLAILIAIIFIFVASFGYDKYVKPLLDKNYVPNKEFLYGEDNNDIIIYFFYTTWCPYCKKARPIWDEFKEKINSDKTYIENYNIIFREIDCDKESNLVKQFNIEGYPTIKLVRNNKTYNYDAKPDVNNLMEFFKGSL